LVAKSGVTSYDKLFPNLDYRFSMRQPGAHHAVLGRPAYEDARPLALFTYDLITNPTTRPTTAPDRSMSAARWAYEAVNTERLAGVLSRGRGLISVAAYGRRSTIRSTATGRGNVITASAAVTRRHSVRADSGRISGLELNLANLQLPAGAVRRLRCRRECLADRRDSLGE
jgi:hypothetical protein